MFGTLLLLLLTFNLLSPSTILADTYEYIPPVDVGSNPQRSPPQNINHPENKDASVYSNNINQDPVTCSFSNTVSEDKEPNGIFNALGRLIRYLTTPIRNVSENKHNSTFTNSVLRDSQLHFAKDPAIKLDDDEAAKKSFKSYDLEARNASIRSKPYKYLLVDKGLLIEESTLSLGKDTNVTALDEPIAWNCQGKCQELFDENGQKPSNCQPITISEIGYYYFTQNQSTSYELQDNQAINIPFSPQVMSIYQNYKQYRPKFTSLLSSSCYEKLYEGLSDIPRGSLNTKFIFYNKEEDNRDVPKTEYQTLPLAASLASPQTSHLLDLFLPNNQEIETNSEKICQNLSASPPILDAPSPINIFTYIKNFLIHIILPQTVSRPIKIDAVYPETLVENLAKDEKFLEHLLPQKEQEKTQVNTKSKSSFDNQSSAQLPDPGYSNSIKRIEVWKNLSPASWLEEINNPRSGEIDSSAPGESSDKVLRWCPYIKNYAQQNGISPAIIAAIITIESQGNPNAISWQGAVGLMQVMPRDGLATQFRCNGRPCFADRPTTQELRNPEFNIKYGTSLLASMIRYWGGLREGIKHYGPMGYGYKYVDMVMGVYNRNPNACK